MSKALEIAQRWANWDCENYIPFRQNEDIFVYDEDSQEFELAEIIVARALIKAEAEIIRLNGLITCYQSAANVTCGAARSVGRPQADKAFRSEQ